jgi:hypothetical protein
MPMGTATRQGQALRVALCEVECGVFYATYPDCQSASDAAELEVYQIGASVDDAKQRIEQRVQALGYDSVIWTETIIVPLFASHANTAPHEPAAIYAARRGT